MAMGGQAATPAAAKPSWQACAQWRTDRVGDPKLAVIAWYRSGLKRYLWRRDVKRSAVSLAVQRRSAKAFAVIWLQITAKTAKLPSNLSTRSDAQSVEVIND
jgi:hypothetical protein